MSLLFKKSASGIGEPQEVLSPRVDDNNIRICHYSTPQKCFWFLNKGRIFQDLKRRIRKIPGVPIMFIANHRYAIERMPDAYGDKTA
jgi:Fcf1